ncbi:zinc-binding dehydrogenase [Streptomyces rubradiris]
MQTLFSCVASGRIKVINGGTFPLADAAKAHHVLKSRTRTGKFCLDTTK